ncbi:threonine/homoserine efflux transporter RhtA [Geodermatophilus bullaregiensis]|nr:DMT family transporter [Geodermatophilus bullaregiensis]MBM7804620.1 threonine/homoserine efflux transporter RhtA [Geodermatophilus bullaregiensis]
MTRSPAAPVPAAVVVTVLAWASAFIGIRAVGDDLSPGPLALGRLLVGTAVLALLSLRRGWVAPTRREWGLVAVCGAAWFGVYDVALNAAEQHLDAGTTAMLVNTGPILIAVLAGVWLGEGFPRRLVAGLVVAFAGVLLIGLAGRDGGADLAGVVLCLVAAVTYAVGVVAQEPVLRRLPPLQVTLTACAIGAVRCLPWAGVLAQERPRRRRRRCSGRSTPVSCRRRWRSARGPPRWRGPRPAGSASPPTWCRRWWCCRRGCCSTRCRPRSRSPVAPSASPGWPWRAAAGGCAGRRRRWPGPRSGPRPGGRRAGRPPAAARRARSAARSPTWG